jgi:tetratricopeptide (TPR) repeat protein
MTEQQIRVPVGIDEIVAAVAALTWAARYDVARGLLDSAVSAVDGDEAARRLALASAATAVHHDFRTVGPRWAPDAIAAARSAVGHRDQWQLEFLELQHDYGRELIGPDGNLRFGPDGRDPGRAAALALRAEALAASASDVADGGWAAFYRGLIGDNLTGDRAGAPRWLDRALEAAGQAGDDYLAGEALRHLGDHDEEAGELEQARARWERSAQLWARAGNVTGVLAQQILLAQLAVTEGRPAAGTAIAREVSRWAGALGLVLYQRHADAVVADAASALTGEAGAHPAGTADLLPAGAEDLLPAGEDDRS